MLNSAEHEILATYKQQITDDYSCYSCLVQLIMKFSLLMNMKIPTLVGILIIISSENVLLS